MIRALTMPAWGMEDAPGTVVNWIAKEGDQVKLGEELVEIETTKLTNVVESPFEGKLTKVVLQKGDNAPTGSLLAIVVEGDASPQEIDAFIAEHSQSESITVENNPVERVVDTAHGKVRVMTLAGGTATPVILLHGFGADWTSWSFIVRGLSRKRSVHVIDLPGHGSSFKDLGSNPIETLVGAFRDVASTLETPLHLVGHSLGGLVAIEAASKTPEKFKSVSLLAPAGISSSINGPFLELFADADSRKNARAAIEMLVSNRDAVSLSMVNDVIRARRVEGAKDALHALRAALAGDGRQTIDVREKMLALKQPVQLILGESDQIIQIDGGQAGVSNTTTVSGAGHLLHMEKAGEVEKLLDGFMERNDG